MRLFVLVISVTMAFLVASAASAISVTIVNALPASLNVGDEFDIEIAFDNVAGLEVNGVVVQLRGLAGVLDVISGSSADSISPINGARNPVHLNEFCSSTQCFGGLSTPDGPNFNPNNLVAFNYSPGDDAITLISAVAFSATTATGAADPGLAGSFGTQTGLLAVDATVRVRAVSSGDIEFATSVLLSTGETQTIVSDSTSITVVPEPGTALLMGLGLAGLAAVGRRD